MSGNVYQAFYKGRVINVVEDTSYEAQKTAARAFEAKHSYEVAVVLVEKDGEKIVHKPLM
jgi:hypothetical protein